MIFHSSVDLVRSLSISFLETTSLHVSFEALRVASLKFELFADLGLDEGQVDEDVDHITLLAVIALVVISIHNQILPIRYVYLDVVERANVHWVRHQVVPCDALNRLLRNTDIVHCLNEFSGSKSELVGLVQVLILLDNPVCITQLDCLEKVGQIFVNLDIVGRDGEAPLLQR